MTVYKKAHSSFLTIWNSKSVVTSLHAFSRAWRRCACTWSSDWFITSFAFAVIGHSIVINRPFPSCFEPHCESEAKCKGYIMKISFHSYADKTNFHMKSLALTPPPPLPFHNEVERTRKWVFDSLSVICTHQDHDWRKCSVDLRWPTIEGKTFGLIT